MQIGIYVVYFIQHQIVNGISIHLLDVVFHFKMNPRHIELGFSNVYLQSKIMILHFIFSVQFTFFKIDRGHRIVFQQALHKQENRTVGFFLGFRTINWLMFHSTWNRFVIFLHRYNSSDHLRQAEHFRRVVYVSLNNRLIV